jgi:tryptophan synthase beta chain
MRKAVLIDCLSEVKSMRLNLDIKEIPNRWYNIIPDLDFQVPVPMSRSGYPLTYNDMEPFSPPDIIDEELNRKNREVPIPAGVLSIYNNWHCTPLFRAVDFEKAIGTSARIFYKDEGANPSGSHKMNTAVPQAYYAAKDKNVKCLGTAAGSGEWGVALAIACNYFDLKCKVFMLRSSYDEMPYSRYVMEILGAEVVPSPSLTTQYGRKEIESNSSSEGSIGLALSEAFEDAASRDDTKFAWGSVMNHVLLHQSIIGLEARSQMKKAGANPDLIVSSVAGGGGFGGLAFPFYPERSRNTRFIAVESASAPSLSRGSYAYDYSDAKGIAYMLKMYTLGHGFVSPGIRAADMRYHGISPLISTMYHQNKIEARAYTQHQAFEAAVMFARLEGSVPSPASAYAIKAVMEEALQCRDKNSSRDILFSMDANSHFELDALRDFTRGSLETLESPEKHIQAAIGALPGINES